MMAHRDETIADCGAFEERTRRWAARSAAGWNRAPDTPPDHLPHYTPVQQAAKQRELEGLFAKLPGSQERYDRLSPGERVRLRARVRGWIARSLAPAEDRRADTFFEECEGVADAFIARARTFDAEMPDREIHQALRNQWVFNSLQAFCGRPASLSPSSFAYSMLYPLTDNRLDAPGVSADERTAFVRWLSARLSGTAMGGEGDPYGQIARLLDMIVEEFPRGRFPDVHRSLLAIHNAQKQALSLHAGAEEDREQALLLLTLAKGGASVLVDGYLVNGTLDEVSGEAFFGYGVLLQLIDDLQDLDEDSAHGHSTPFRRAGSGTMLERQTNKLLNVVRAECAAMGAATAAAWLPPLIEQSCVSLILEAIARYHPRYTPRYRGMIGSCMPVPLAYLAGLRSRMHQRLEDVMA